MILRAENSRAGAARLLALIAMVFATQLGLVWWLGQRDFPTPPPRSALAPSLQVAGEGSRDLFNLLDPTLFALPHKEGFSGAAWLSVPAQEIQPFAWTEPPRYLALSPRTLAAFPSEPAQSSPESWVKQLGPNLDLSPPSVIETVWFPTKSSVRVDGDLGARPLLAPLQIPAWGFNDVLTNSVLKLLVDSEGFPFSVNLIERSGSKEADDYAMQLVRKARFAPARQGNSLPDPARLTKGVMVFQWYAVPGSNAPVVLQ